MQQTNLIGQTASNERLSFVRSALRRQTPDETTDGRACPLCASHGTLVRYFRKPRFNRCQTCGAVSRDPFPTEIELQHLYRSSWADHDAHVDETGGTELALGRLIVAALLRELGLAGFAGRHILDFGAGRGGLSMALREMAGQVVAVEPFGYEQLQHLGLPVYRGLDELPPTLLFDGAVMVEVLEHLRDPHDLLRGLQLRLKPGGWLLLTTPNPRGLAAMLRRDRWGSASNAGHILFYAASTLTRLLCDHGFTDIKQTRWLLRFPNVSPVRAVIQSGLQLFHLGGGLRFLAFKA